MLCYSMCVYMYMYVCVYIYIYREREIGIVNTGDYAQAIGPCRRSHPRRSTRAQGRCFSRPGDNYQCPRKKSTSSGEENPCEDKLSGVEFLGP